MTRIHRRRRFRRISVVHPWLTAAADSLARATGLPTAELRLTDADVSTVLDLARIAAHDSERTNAPLVCYLAGLTVARSGKSLDEVAAAVPRNDA
jgi:Domain of unknown function (DUF6457)